MAGALTHHAVRTDLRISKEIARRPKTGTQKGAHHSCALLPAFSASGAWCFITRGVCASANKKIRGMMPQTLNDTQVAVDVSRHTVSLMTASTRKKRPQRTVSLRQPCSLNSKACAKTYLMNKRLKKSPPSSTAPKKP